MPQTLFSEPRGGALALSGLNGTLFNVFTPTVLTERDRIPNMSHIPTLYGIYCCGKLFCCLIVWLKIWITRCCYIR